GPRAHAAAHRQLCPRQWQIAHFPAGGALRHNRRMPLLLSVRTVELARTPCRARLPFRFGGVTVTGADLLTCRVRCEDQQGASTHGWSADLLVQRWFRKDLERTPEQDAAALEGSAQRAATAFTALADRPRPVFSLWREAFAACV